MRKPETDNRNKVAHERTAPNRIARDLDWNLLRTFIVLARSASITDAAERLGLRQPSVSSALKRLEDRLGQRLIDRSPGRYELTEPGKLLYQEALEIEGSIQRLGSLMADSGSNVQGHVSIALASHVCSPHLDQALSAFHAGNPLATFDLDVSTSQEALNRVRARRASLAICLVHRRDPKLQYARLYREYFGLFCGPPHELFGRKALTPADLAGRASVSFVTDRLEDALRPVTLMRAAAELGDHVVGTSAYLEEVKRMVLAGMGIAPLPVHVVARDVTDGVLWQLPPYEDLPAIDVHLVWNPAARRNAAEQALLDLLRRRIEEVPIEERTYGAQHGDQGLR